MPEKKGVRVEKGTGWRGRDWSKEELEGEELEGKGEIEGVTHNIQLKQKK